MPTSASSLGECLCKGGLGWSGDSRGQPLLEHLVVCLDILGIEAQHDRRLDVIGWDRTEDGARLAKRARIQSRDAQQPEHGGALLSRAVTGSSAQMSHQHRGVARVECLQICVGYRLQVSRKRPGHRVEQGPVHRAKLGAADLSAKHLLMGIVHGHAPDASALA